LICKGKVLITRVYKAGLRKRGVDEAVWSFTQKIFAACAAHVGGSKDEL
jgi:hypothetical protein